MLLIADMFSPPHPHGHTALFSLHLHLACCCGQICPVAELDRKLKGGQINICQFKNFGNSSQFFVVRTSIQQVTMTIVVNYATAIHKSEQFAKVINIPYSFQFDRAILHYIEMINNRICYLHCNLSQYRVTSNLLKIRLPFCFEAQS